PSMDRLWIEGAEGRRRFLDRITMSFEPSHAEAVLTYEKGMRERNRLLKDMVRDAHWYIALERQMADASARVTANRRAALERLATASSGAKTAFPSPTLSMTHADGPLPNAADDLAQALADNRPSDLRAGRTLIGPHRIDLHALFTGKGVPAAQCSTGEQKALLISLVLTNARALAEDTGAPPLILLDEVAAHLDADRRAALYDEIAALGAQAWMTGTGAELFGALGARAQYIDVREENGESVAIQKDKP
ncbi:MAG: DNA replication and repair protein RecF, partial [Erythrobacter sp.]